MQSAIQITGYLHTSLLVRDLSASEDFYGRVLGLPKLGERNLSFPGSWYALGSIQLHLIVSEIRDPNSLADPIRWGRNAHIAMGIQNLEAAKSMLEAAGYLYQLSGSGRRALFVRDPDGHVVELTEIGDP